MPEENVPSPPAPEPPRSGAASCLLGVLGCGGVVLVGVVVLIAALAWKSSGATDFPRVAPEEMADRAVQRSEEAYRVLGFTRTVPPGVRKLGVSTRNTLGSSPCYDGGLLGLADETIDGAYSMSHSWALDQVPESQAVPGLRALHRSLKDDGWKITSFDEGEQGDSWDLFVQRDDGKERMSFTWYPDREYFTGGASVPCAYDPEWTEGEDTPGGGLEPPALGAARRG
ncbi:hypothetical protein [Streptomyces sp. NPDC085466]|uniref:hypothetical protein n=1 Tax=Streptomyces sp. NPDC085466 TaxID=3365725 RepID=UPI0037D39622